MFKIYRKKNAFQIDIKKPNVSSKGYIEKDGAIFISAALAKPDGTFDWNDRVTFALSHNDFPKLYEAMYLVDHGKAINVEITHFVKDEPKKFAIKKNDGKGYLFSVLYKGRNTSTIVSLGELLHFFEIVKYASIKTIFDE